MDDSRKEAREELIAKTLVLGASLVGAAIRVLGWAVILFITLISAILNGGKGS